MAFEIWFAFVIAAAVVLIVPGPTVVFVTAKVAELGIRKSIPIAFGIVMGDLICMTLSLLGLGIVMAASSTAFSVVKWAGTAYLIYLGGQIIIGAHKDQESAGSKSNAVSQPDRSESAGSLFISALLLNTLHPKGITFYSSFMPQFISHEESALMQFVTMGLTFLVLASLNVVMYMTITAKMKNARDWERFNTRKWMGYAAGITLLTAGVFTAFI